MKINNNHIFTILGCIFVIITTLYIYRKARTNKLNPVKWASINLGVGFIIQFAIPLSIAIIVAATLVVSKGSAKDIDKLYNKYGLLTNIIILMLNFIGICFIIRRVSTIPDDEIFVAPPSPPTFDEKP